MSSQTPINRLGEYQRHEGRLPTPNGPTTPSGGPADLPHERGVKQLILDIAGLAELQIRLLTEDVQSAIASTVRPAAVLLVGVAATLSAMAVLLLGIAGGLSAGLGWSLWSAQLLTAGVTLVICVVVVIAASRRLTKSGDPIVRSMRELSENVASLKNAVKCTDETTTRP